MSAQSSQRRVETLKSPAAVPRLWARPAPVADLVALPSVKCATRPCATAAPTTITSNVHGVRRYMPGKCTSHPGLDSSCPQEAQRFSDPAGVTLTRRVAPTGSRIRAIWLLFLLGPRPKSPCPRPLQLARLHRRTPPILTRSSRFRCRRQHTFCPPGRRRAISGPCRR